MKLWLATVITLFLFSGCNSHQKNIRLQNKNAKLIQIIQQQNAKIEALKAKISARNKRKARIKRRPTLPTPPKKNIKLKKVEDNNYSSGYMYPAAKKKTVKVAQATTTSTSTFMDRAQCITMIGQEKFDKYTQMFGSEAASLKRCKMLKAMKQ